MDDPTHRDLVAALSRLATLVRAYDPDGADSIEHSTARLAESPPAERRHADIVKAVLSTALDVFARRIGKSPAAELRAEYVDARHGLDTITAEAPLRAQTNEVVATLRSLTNVVAMLQGARPVFPTGEHADAVGHDPRAFAERAKRTSVLVREFAADRDWTSSGARAALALDGFADVLAAAPLAIPRAEWKLAVGTIRFEALELRREGFVSLDRSDRIKAGLQAVVDGLRMLRDHDTPAIRALVANATDAVAGIDPGTIFVFQRGMIQEAFRATADACLVIALPSGSQAF